MCHVALGIVEAYWEYRLKPWDMAAGVLVCFEFCVIDNYSDKLMRPNFLD